MLFQEGDRVRTVSRFKAGVVRHVVDTPNGRLYHVYKGSAQGPNFAWRWETVSNLQSAADEKWGRFHMARLYGKKYPVYHIDATGHIDMYEIEADVKSLRRADRSVYVTHMELVRKTKHRHPIGCKGMFRGKNRYVPQYDADEKRMRSKCIRPTPRPCTIVSQDARYSWSGYTDSAYTVKFTDGSMRSYIMGSQFMPI